MDVLSVFVTVAVVVVLLLGLPTLTAILLEVIREYRRLGVGKKYVSFLIVFASAVVVLAWIFTGIFLYVLLSGGGGICCRVC